MANKKVLFITQEIFPYLEETPISRISRYLPQAIHDKGKEIRTFMPKYGTVNERRNQLHEVIRLSGMNLIIDDTDYSLILKVASIQAARMQVYFIDNEDYFQNKGKFACKENVEYCNNDERSIFFIRGVMETVKKLRCIPDVVHCHGWFSALAPMIIKRAYADDPCLSNSKIITSIYNESFSKPLSENFAEKMRFEDCTDEDIANLKARGTMDYVNLMKLAVDYSDGVIQGCTTMHEDIKEHILNTNTEFLVPSHDFQVSVHEINAFYDKIIG